MLTLLGSCWHQFHAPQLETKVLRMEKEKDVEQEGDGEGGVQT